MLVGVFFIVSLRCMCISSGVYILYMHRVTLSTVYLLRSRLPISVVLTFCFCCCQLRERASTPAGETPSRTDRKVLYIYQLKQQGGTSIQVGHNAESAWSASCSSVGRQRYKYIAVSRELWQALCGLDCTHSTK